MILSLRELQATKRQLDETIGHLQNLSLQMGLLNESLQGGIGRPGKAKQQFKDKHIAIWRKTYTRTIAELQAQAARLTGGET